MPSSVGNWTWRSRTLRKASDAGSAVTASTSIATRSAPVMGTSPGARLPATLARSIQPHPGVDHSVQNVDDDVCEDDEEGREQDDGHDDGQILVEGGVHGGAAQPGHAENRLGQHGPAKQRAQVEAEY